MRRVLATLVAIVTAGLAVAWPAQGGDGGEYLVRAVFDNASFITEANEVRVAGATVGIVKSVEVSMPGEVVGYDEDGNPEEIPGKAVIVMEITDAGFKDFRTDASCIVRPQSLIGERYLDCLPTQPRAAGTPPPPELSQVPEGQAGAGEYLLPLENNGKAVDIDLVQNVMQYPYRERFRIILNELGVGLAARGDDLDQVIRRGNPALQQTDRVLKILADQRRDLETLAVEGNRVMEPLARVRGSVVNFLNYASITGKATAERQPALEEGIRKLPRTLVEVRKTMKRLEAVGRQGYPMMRDFRKAVPYLNVATKNLPELLAPDAGIAAIESLGTAVAVGNPPTEDSIGNNLSNVYANGLLGQVNRLGNNAEPAAKALEPFFTTFEETGGIRQLTDTVYNLAAATNGYDEYGHMIRGVTLVNGCVDYATIAFSGCIANWGGRASNAADLRLALRLWRKEALRASGGVEAPTDAESLPELDPEPAAGQTAPGEQETQAEPPSPEGDGNGDAKAAPADPASERRARRMMRAEILLSYLLGGGGR